MASKRYYLVRGAGTRRGLAEHISNLMRTTVFAEQDDYLSYEIWSDRRPRYWKPVKGAAPDARDAEILALKAERDALRADAERYRWLRDPPDTQGERVFTAFEHVHGQPWFGTMLDDAIDAARSPLASDSAKS